MDLALIGLGAMGRNLVANLIDKGWRVVGYDIEPRLVDTCRRKYHHDLHQFLPCTDLTQLTATLQSPRIVMMMITAGPDVDQLLDQLLPQLHPDDVVLDGGNSHFGDTIRRQKKMAGQGIHYFGAGISGGIVGARHGPAIMVGGPATNTSLWPILTSLAARYESTPCLIHAGPDGSGHFVKMVHNGIEYADMQILSEAQCLLHSLVGLDYIEQADVFDQWNRGELSSFLTDITGRILRRHDPLTGQPALEVIADEASQKGTGLWTAQEALNLEISVPNLTQAVDARWLSCMRTERNYFFQHWPTHVAIAAGNNRDEMVTALSEILLAARITVFSQGFALLRKASIHFEWNLDLEAISRCWRGGCVLQGVLLERIRCAWAVLPQSQHLLLDPELGRKAADGFHRGRPFLAQALAHGLPIPGLITALSYWDTLRHQPLWTRMIAAQRDYFGAHGFQRIDTKGSDSWNWSC
ncbi:MAG: NADP-dependent phosphogluconate dehydrogenase [Magnetococcales bacterium]|nr:NADP-dependent phosphogluconate dehydrogenase [Magnetococcales bacterium]